MKIKNYITLIVIFISCSALAQDNPDASSAYGNQNILKLNLTSLGFVNIYLQDEYTLNGSSSVALGLSYMPSRSLPSAVIENDPNGNAGKISFSGFSITPEYRWYVKKHAPKGFYLAPYFRYTSYTTTSYSFSYDRANTNGAIQDVATLEGSLSGIGLGLMIGDQFKLGDHVTLDWWIIGAGFGSGKIKMEGTGNFSTSQQEDLRTEIASMDVPVGDLESEVTGSSVSITYKTGLPSLRGFGLAIGYIF
ncbi:MAG: DUF3575 domain-containing protein [Bacteroidetes bacterium]|nr:DUF3575 domain-containing protein [Bacteroidota bacterium]